MDLEILEKQYIKYKKHKKVLLTKTCDFLNNENKGIMQSYKLRLLGWKAFLPISTALFFIHEKIYYTCGKMI